MPSAKNFLTHEEAAAVVKAIAAAELQTSGEIRVHLENFCWGSPIKAAQKLFFKLGMQQTRERNGVLIYMATYSRKIAIVGDEGIHSKLPKGYWDKMVAKMIEGLKSNKPESGLVACIADCGDQLKHFFPRAQDDTNELSNEISFK